MGTLKSSPIALELSQLGHEFIEGQEVFKQINTKISAGSHVVINGQNGSGKSTLGKILAGQLTSTQGSIVWKENEQVIPQESVLLASSYSGPSATLHPQMSIEEILHFHGMFRPWREGANPRKCLQDAGLSTHMGVRFAELSSGMKQRVLLTVSLCTKSGLVVLDEPCANLDRSGIDWYQRQLSEFPSSSTLVICTNDRPEDFLKAESTLEL